MGFRSLPVNLLREMEVVLLDLFRAHIVEGAGTGAEVLGHCLTRLFVSGSVDEECQVIRPPTGDLDDGCILERLVKNAAVAF